MATRTGHILVVEDEKPVLENIVDLLEGEGFVVSKAHDGEEAFRWLQTNRPDLILCDIRMPRMNGLELLARLNHQPQLIGTPFIFLTALDERSDLRAAMELGADDYITKPFTRTELVESIDQRLRKFASIQNDARKKTTDQNAVLVRAMPYELQQSLAVILQKADDILTSPSTAEIDAVKEAARQIHLAGERLTHSLASYILLSNLNRNPLAIHDQADRQPDALQVGSLIKEMAQATAWQYHRVSDLDVHIRDGRVMINEVVLQRIVEEVLASVFIRTRAGTPVKLSCGRYYDKGRNYYAMTVSDTGPAISRDQMEGMERADWESLPEFLELGIGLALAQKLVVLNQGQFIINREDQDTNQIIIRFLET